MKIFSLLALPILLLVSYFIFPEQKKNPEAEPESFARQEEPNAPSPQPEAAVSLSLLPAAVIQGEPARIAIQGVASPSDIESLTFDAKQIPVFADADTVGALVGIDFHKKPGSYPIVLALKDGRTIEEKFDIGERVVSTEKFDIPEQLGGNTSEAEHKLSSSLAEDTALIQRVLATTASEKLWEVPFRLPLDGALTITDVYGYKRQTGSVSLSHQGTDFRASEGTPVYAMNQGKVAFSGTFRNYGETVIIDHGLGLMTFYMHLSEREKKKGESVGKGDLIAKSGNTGYSLGPHLHLSVRIDGFSIDPMKFLDLMGPK